MALGSEVIIGFSLRVKKELGRNRTWVMGYCNDVMAYNPSLRVHRNIPVIIEPASPSVLS